MSHVPGNLVYKRFLNALKSPSGSGPVPPVGQFIIYRATSPAPAESVVPPASTERATFMTHLLVSGVYTFESDPAGVILSVPININGGTCTMDFLSGSDVIMAAPIDGAFNTTPAGTKYAYPQIYSPPDGPSVRWTFGTPIAAFGAYFTDVGESIFGSGVVMCTLYPETGSPFTSAINTDVGVSGELVFWGFTDTTGQRYTKLELFLDLGEGFFDPIGIDDVIYALQDDVVDP